MSTLVDNRRRTAHTGIVRTPVRRDTPGTTLDYSTVRDVNLAVAVASFTADLAGTLATTLNDIRIRSAQILEKVFVPLHGHAPGSTDSVDLGWVTVPGSAEDVGRAAAEPALREAAETLGIKLTEACVAAGISWRTFQSWTPDTKPRVASQGQLWQLVHLAEDLNALLSGKADQWVAANPSARAAILQGRFGEAMNELINDRARRDMYRDISDLAPVAPAGSVGIEADVDLRPMDAAERVTSAVRRGGARRSKRGTPGG
jgi:hypothetical protein